MPYASEAAGKADVDAKVRQQTLVNSVTRANVSTIWDTMLENIFQNEAQITSPWYEDITDHGGSTGATNNQVAVMAAIAAAVASGSNAVFVPPGVWPCDGQILFAAGQSNVRIFGGGMHSSILDFSWDDSATGPAGAYIEIPDTAGVSEIQFEDIWIRGSSPGTSRDTTNIVHALRFSLVSGVYFNRVRISKTSGFGFHGEGCSRLQFDSCYVHHTSRDGITNFGREGGQLKDLSVTNCIMHDIHDDFVAVYDQSANPANDFGDAIAGFTTTAGSASATGTGLNDADHLNRVIWIQDAGPGGAPMFAKVINIAGTAITLDRPSLNDSSTMAVAGILPAEDVVIANNIFDGGGDTDAGGRGIVFGGVVNGVISGNHVERTQFDGCLIFNSVRSAANFTLVWCKDITVTGNTFRYSGLGGVTPKHGARVWGCQDLQWDNNIVSNAADIGLYMRDAANCFIGGTFHDNATDGVRLDGTNATYKTYGIRITADSYRNLRSGIDLVSTEEVHLDGCQLSDNGDGTVGGTRVGVRITDGSALSGRTTMTGLKAWDSRPVGKKTQQHGIWATDSTSRIELAMVSTSENVNPDSFGSATVTSAQIAPNAVSNAALADMAAWTLKARNAATLGDPEDVAQGDLTEEPTPSGGHKLIGFLGTGEIRTFDVGNLPTAGGGEANTSSNVGGGLGLANAKSGINLPFKTLNTSEFVAAADVVSLVTGGVATGKIADNAITNAKAADMAAWSVKARNNAAPGDPQDVAEADIAEEATPAGGHMLIGFLGTGEIRKFDVANLPTGTSLPVVDETAIVFKTGQPTFTLTVDVDAFTAARTWTAPDQAIDFTPGGTYPATVHTHAAADVTTGTFADARVAASNVTQHVGAIDHDALLNYAIGQHRIINDAGTSATELWSASKIDTAIAAATTLPVPDTTVIAQDDGDPTKEIRFELSGLTTGNLGVLTPKPVGDNIYNVYDHEVLTKAAYDALPGGPDAGTLYYITDGDQIATSILVASMDVAPPVTGSAVELHFPGLIDQGSNVFDFDIASVTEEVSPVTTWVLLIQDPVTKDFRSVQITNLPGGGGINNVVEDTTPQLGGMLDVNGFSIGDGTLELIKFVETGSAVNELTVTNAATGDAPSLTATGDDTPDIWLELGGKGAGGYQHTKYALPPTIRTKRTDGTPGAETPVPSGQSLGTYEFLGNEQSTPGGAYVIGAVIRALAAETFAVGARGTNIEFVNVENGTTAERIRMRLRNDGAIQWGKDFGSGFAIANINETLTASRNHTYPDAVIDWTGAADQQVMGYTVSTNTWGPITPTGGGDVSKVGTPVNDQVGVWTGDGTIEGTVGLTYSGTALDVTGDITLSGTVDTRDIAADGSKLDGIEAGATADQTAAEIRGLGFFDITNDGAGSGLDADLLDGSEAAAFGLVASPLSQFGATTSIQLHATITNPTGTGLLVFATNPTLSGATFDGSVAMTAASGFTSLRIFDSDASHKYVLITSNLVADRNMTLPLLTGDDTFVFASHTATLTNKTLTSPVINTTVTGTALADVATTSTGSAADQLVTPDGLGGSVHGTKAVNIVLFDSTTDVAVGEGTIAFTVPVAMNGMDLVNVVASVHTKGVTGSTNVMVRRRRAGVDVDMLSVAVTIGDEFFASDETIDTANDDVLAGDQIYIDVDAIHTTAPKGLSVILEFRVP